MGPVPEAAARRELPMFPLGTVLFPHMALPLHVFEPRYRAMVRDVLAGDGEFGVVLIERGHEVGGGDARFEVGTVARLLECVALPDGRYAMTAFGVARIEVDEWLPDDPYPRATVRTLDDDAGDLADPADPSSPRADSRTSILELEQRALELYAMHAQLDGRAPVPASLGLHEHDDTIASYELCARSPLGPIDALDLLRQSSVAARLAHLALCLADQRAMLEARLDGR